MKKYCLCVLFIIFVGLNMGCHHVQPNASSAPVSTTNFDDAQDDYVKNDIKMAGHMDDVGQDGRPQDVGADSKTFQAWQLETLSPSIIMSKIMTLQTARNRLNGAYLIKTTKDNISLSAKKCLMCNPTIRRIFSLS